MQEKFDTVQEKFSKQTEILSSLSKSGFSLEISVVMHFGDHPPELNLSEKSIEWIASIGASLDVDIYLYAVD